ncbi:MAG: ArsR/SmtB family transcription factor [Thermoplasmatota archaeon]
MARPLVATFQALADPTRLAIVERLRRGPATLTEVGAPMGMSLPAVLKHVRILEASGLVVGHRTGRTRHLRLRAAPMRDAMRYLATYQQFWEDRLDALAVFLDKKE